MVEVSLMARICPGNTMVTYGECEHWKIGSHWVSWKGGISLKTRGFCLLKGPKFLDGVETEGFLLHPRLGRAAQTGSKTDTEELKMDPSLNDTSRRS